MNRSLRRAALHELRSLGCLCAPRITTERTDVLIHHENGCPLGDLFVVANLAGFLPTLHLRPRVRCER